MSTLLVVRHGQTPWNRERRIQGWAPVGLSTVGESQARALGAVVADEYDVDRIVASDLRRTVETTRWLRRSIDAPTTFDTGWRERDVGVLQGLSYEALFEGHPEFALRSSGYHAVEATPEGGESLLDVRTRVLEAFEDQITAVEPGETVLVVTHGGPVRIVLGHLLDLDLCEAIGGLTPENCSLTELDVDRNDVDVCRRAASLDAVRDRVETERD